MTDGWLIYHPRLERRWMDPLTHKWYAWLDDVTCWYKKEEFAVRVARQNSSARVLPIIITSDGDAGVDSELMGGTHETVQM